MEFYVDKVFVSLNADAMKIGSKGYCADSLVNLKAVVENEVELAYGEVTRINDKDCLYRFRIDNRIDKAFFYLVEESKEKFRPYKDTDEMIEDFKKRYNSYGGWSGKDNPMYNPMIWIKAKGAEKNKYLITRFHENTNVTMNFNQDVFTTGLPTLLDDYTYLDGTPCGIKEE